MKVYLAKSNRCNPLDYMTIRSLLLSHKVEILEHTGGTYTDTKLLSADMLIVLPESTKMPMTLGKGLYMQISTFGRNKGGNLWIVTNTGSLTATAIDSECIHIHDSMDYANYAKYTDPNPVNKYIVDMLPLKYDIIL